jgi:UTP:GlnB (protein PII) uridylyltransferase
VSGEIVDPERIAEHHPAATEGHVWAGWRPSTLEEFVRACRKFFWLRGVDHDSGNSAPRVAERSHDSGRHCTKVEAPVEG